MCGIAGYLDFNHGMDVEILKKMSEVMTHRGPDDEGYVLFSENSFCEFKGKKTVSSLTSLPMIGEKENDAFLGFAHRRLSIIDLSAAGHQPMSYKNGRLWITYNGEIYNYLEIRKQLQELGYIFTTKSDTEVILTAYVAWGQKCVEHFNGMWSFVIYDRDNQILFCSRDRLGAKPFYYYLCGNHFAFGSEIKVVCQDCYLRHFINDRQLASRFLLGLSDYNEETLVQDVFSLMGGNNLVLKLDIRNRTIVSVQKYMYWDLNMNEASTEQDDWYRAIQTAIHYRLRSDVPIGLMVSGGVDSSFLASEITRQVSGNNVHSFSTCYSNDTENDESYYANLVNRTFGFCEHYLYPDANNAFSSYRRMIWHLEDYAGYDTLGAFLTVEQVARTGVKVIINGQGGDETMLGYSKYYIFFLKSLLLKAPMLAMKNIPQILSSSELGFGRFLKMLLCTWFPQIHLRFRRWQISSRYKLNFKELCPWSEIDPLISNRTYEEAIYKEIRHRQLTKILRMDDKLYMAFSIESRVPFIDYKYLEKAIAYRPQEKIQKGYTKYLLRERMVNRVPAEVVWRRKKNGWASSASYWTSHFVKEELEELIHDSRAAIYFEMNNIKQSLLKDPTSRYVNEFIFTELFMRLFELTSAVG